MTGEISRFSINNLHNLRTINVEINQNTLIIVGENGSGKSTVANFIYYFLTRQWVRLLDFKFESISATIDNETYSIKRDDLVDISHDLDKYRRHFPISAKRELEFLLRKYSFEDLINDRDLLVFNAKKIGIPTSVLIDYIIQFSSNELPLSTNLQKIEKKLSEAINYQVVYLPTYRRIEQDLRAIFPGLEESREIRDRLRRRTNESHYIELVEFGMEDVELTIKNKMTSIKDNVRNELNNLTWTYLRDVIQNAYRSVDLPTKIRELDDNAVRTIFNRVPKDTLSLEDQNRLSDIVVDIRNQGSIRKEDEVVAHFLTQLIDLYKSQLENEKEIREFVEICNEYLTGKRIEYDSRNFEITIHQDQPNNLDQDITLKMLSSGEKQIVSLFSHIYLSGINNYLVIIDEPELSLSVPWQKKFLPDILNTKRCKGLIAVTHSPFIFDNELEQYVHSLDEFIEAE